MIIRSPAHTCSPQNRSPCCGSRYPHSYQFCVQGRGTKPSAETAGAQAYNTPQPSGTGLLGCIQRKHSRLFFPVWKEKKPPATFFTQKPRGLAGSSKGWGEGRGSLAPCPLLAQPPPLLQRLVQRNSPFLQVTLRAVSLLLYNTRGWNRHNSTQVLELDLALLRLHFLLHRKRGVGSISFFWLTPKAPAEFLCNVDTIES